jgi:mRNA-degrading endonuclease RelE of RelBE toxin-antitoxin system
MKREGAVFKTNPVEILQDKTKQQEELMGLRPVCIGITKSKREKKSSKKNEQGVKCRVWSLRRGNYRVTITSNDQGKFFIYVPCKPRKVYLHLHSPAIFHVRCQHLAHLRARVCPLYWLESGG